MPNAYLALKQKHQEEVNNFPMEFALSDAQFKKGMERLGLTEEDTDKVCSIVGGGFIRKTDVKAFKDMYNRHEKEKQDAIDRDLTGEGFICDMFAYELVNHEYGYTGDIEPAIEALGLTLEEVKANERLLNGLTKARKRVE